MGQRVGRMLIRVLLPIQIVQKPRQAPLMTCHSILPKPVRIREHRRGHHPAVMAQRRVIDPCVEEEVGVGLGHKTVFGFQFSVVCGDK
jgi:hypothetical protein